MDLLTCLNEAVAAGRPVALVTVVEAPDRSLVGRHLLADAAGVLLSELADAALEQALQAEAAAALERDKAGTVRVSGLRCYVEPFMPAHSLVVVGAGHVAQPVAQLAKMIGFHVTVVDDRPEWANRERFPTADVIICDEMVETVRQLPVGPRHYAVLVTRGHRYDADCLRELVERPLAYIGMIGSRTRVGIVFDMLRTEYGVDPAHFERVYSPIGLDLGARTPAEIGVAIGAELLRVRNGGTGEHLSRLNRARVHRG